MKQIHKRATGGCVTAAGRSSSGVGAQARYPPATPCWLLLYSRSLRRLTKIFTADQLEDQLIKRDLGLVIGAGEADQLTVQVHGVVASLAIVDDFFAIHTRPSFQACGAPL